MSAPLLSVSGLHVHYGAIHAVRGVSFELGRSETLGLVGESGCGKTSLARALVKLTRPSSGTVRFDGPPRKLQLVFQDPHAALDPRMTVRAALAEPLDIAGLPHARMPELLEAVGLGPELLPRLPRELSAGQRQRINIARALSVEPTLLVLDEPVSALDVSVQAQVLNLLSELQQRRGLTYLLISHDLAVVSHLATRIAVMREGELVELGPAEQVIVTPQHPYTRALLEAAARLAL
ncbi:MAG: ABC transporter ATP-binding protein [Archangiaceae bacterium]|nr:ABC transporter ATP-binding protein [Archangiaceae bacterium]